MKLSLCHLYPDLMNLYGDFGNILALRHRGILRGLEWEYHKVSIGDHFDPSGYDLFFIGGGQDNQQKLILDDLACKRSALYNFAESGLPFLCICGGYQLMGQYFRTQNGEEIQGVGWLPVVTEGRAERLIGDVTAELVADGIGKASRDHILYGFENHSGRTYLQEGAQPLARILTGSGNNGEDPWEGCKHKAVLGTYLHGSFLPKNPFVTDYLIQEACRVHLKDAQFQLEELEYSKEEFVRTLEARRQKANS